MVQHVDDRKHDQLLVLCRLDVHGVRAGEHLHEAPHELLFPIARLHIAIDQREAPVLCPLLCNRLYLHRTYRGEVVFTFRLGSSIILAR